jgi:phytoene dehydrogenase-like protein
MTMMITGMRKTLPRLQNFYLAGQWVEPGGGLALAAYSGRNAIRLICQEDDIPFITDPRLIGAST